MAVPQAKQLYVAPKLVNHGTIEALTGQGSSDIRKVVDGTRTLAEERPFRS